MATHVSPAATICVQACSAKMIIATQPIITGQPDKARREVAVMVSLETDELSPRGVDEVLRFLVFTDLAILSVNLIL